MRVIIRQGQRKNTRMIHEEHLNEDRLGHIRAVYPHRGQLLVLTYARNGKTIRLRKKKSF